jgi:hypothetical protein
VLGYSWGARGCGLRQLKLESIMSALDCGEGGRRREGEGERAHSRQVGGDRRRMGGRWVRERSWASDRHGGVVGGGHDLGEGGGGGEE